jgi:hypothetical protein
MKDGRLQASDLMIGDWVDADCHKEIVEQIERSVLTTNDWAYDWKDSIIKPIPLTKEILEKIGFVNDYYEEGCVADYGYIKHDGYTLTYKNEEVDAIITWCNGCVSITTEHGDDVQITIKYLHELQHAFKLCRIKKEIEL